MFFSMPDLFPPIVPRIYLPPFDIRSEGMSFKSQVFQAFTALAPVAPAPADHVFSLSPTWHERSAAAAAAK